MGSDKKSFFDWFGLSDKSDWSGFSEGNGGVRKRGERDFDEKRV